MIEENEEFANLKNEKFSIIEKELKEVEMNFLINEEIENDPLFLL